MIKSAINRILELSAPNTIDFCGLKYVDKKMERLGTELRAEPIELNTLSSLVDYIKHFNEPLKHGGYLIRVASPSRVEMMSALDPDRKRETLVVVNAELPRIPFGSYIDNEHMLITVQSMFANDPTTDRDLVLKFAGTVTNGSVKEYGDDGVTQKATIKQGISSKTEAIVPSPCILRPFRTFPEVEQPASSFIFRMREDKNGDIESALFEADGGAWKNEARRNIHQYLEIQLAGLPSEKDIIVIS